MRKRITSTLEERVSLIESYLEGRKSEDIKDFSEQAEREAFANMQSEIDNERDAEIKIFMQDLLEYICVERSSGPLCDYYKYDYWHGKIKERKALQKSVKPVSLYVDLVSILASHSDSSRYTTYPGPSPYPLTIPNLLREEQVYKLDCDMPRVGILESYIKFGAHEFSVGHAVQAAINYLEKRYGLDFEKLERAHQGAKK